MKKIITLIYQTIKIWFIVNQILVLKRRKKAQIIKMKIKVKM